MNKISHHVNRQQKLNDFKIINIDTYENTNCSISKVNNTYFTFNIRYDRLPCDTPPTLTK